MRTIALESFKILNNLSPAYLNDLLTFKNHSYNFRYQKTHQSIYLHNNQLYFRSYVNNVIKKCR